MVLKTHLKAFIERGKQFLCGCEEKGQKIVYLIWDTLRNVPRNSWPLALRREPFNFGDSSGNDRRLLETFLATVTETLWEMPSTPGNPPA
jgi:hypothetical protein